MTEWEKRKIERKLARADAVKTASRWTEKYFGRNFATKVIILTINGKKFFYTLENIFEGLYDIGFEDGRYSK